MLAKSVSKHQNAYKDYSPKKMGSSISPMKRQFSGMQGIKPAGDTHSIERSSKLVIGDADLYKDSTF